MLASLFRLAFSLDVTDVLHCSTRAFIHVNAVAHKMYVFVLPACCIDIFEDLVSPVVAAQTFLSTACAKRKNTLDPVMAFCGQVLSGERDARRKDGVLNVIGQVADTLMKVITYWGCIWAGRRGICPSPLAEPICPLQ